MSRFINGQYICAALHHGKPYYTRTDCEIHCSYESYLYFWDGREDRAMRGWWVGPSLGGDTVWAFSPGPGVAHGGPPQSNWRVPHDEELDTTLTVRLLYEQRNPGRLDPTTYVEWRRVLECDPHTGVLASYDTFCKSCDWLDCTQSLLLFQSGPITLF